VYTAAAPWARASCMTAMPTTDAPAWMSTYIHTRSASSDCGQADVLTLLLFEATNSPKGLSGGDPVFGNTSSLPLREDIQFIDARLRRHIDNSAYA
jgi:hypothetical protein